MADPTFVGSVFFLKESITSELGSSDFTAAMLGGLQDVGHIGEDMRTWLL